MDRDGQEMPRFSEPNGHGRSDAGANMNPQDHGPRVRKFQDPSAAIEALVRWDELGEADLREIESDPHLGPRLQTLRAAQDWLERSGADHGDFPSAEALYDYAGGPGHSPLSAEENRRIDEHLWACTACEELLLTLADAPPSPLVLDPPATTIRAPRRRE